MSYIKIAEQVKGIERQLEAIQQAKAERSMNGGGPLKYWNELKLKREAKVESERRKHESKKDLVEDKCQREIDAIEDDIVQLQEKVKKQIDDLKKKILVVEQRKDAKLKDLDEKFEILKKENEDKAEEYAKTALECLNAIPKTKLEIELELKLNDLKPKIEQYKKEEREEGYANQMLAIERNEHTEIQALQHRLADIQYRCQSICAEVIDCEMAQVPIPDSIVVEAHALATKQLALKKDKQAIHAKYAQDREIVKAKFPEQSKRIDTTLKEIDEDAKLSLEERIRRGKEFDARHKEVQEMEQAWEMERARLKARFA